MWGIRGTAPLTFNLGARWRWVVSFTCWPIYFWYPLNGARGGAVGWCTALQAGRSQVQFLMVSLEFWHGYVLHEDGMHCIAHIVPCKM
jgi:hypothetical protein